YIPKEIYLNLKLKEKYLLINWLKNIKKEEVKLFFPKRGKKYELLSLAGKNAEIFLENYFKKEEQAKKSLKNLKDLLKLKSSPKRIESIDISNLSGKKAVGAIIVFQDGKPLKQEYRKFKIKTLDTPNDYLMLEEVLKRRIKIWKLNPPSILLIDGGKGHLNIARKLFEKEKIKILPLALAKENEFLFIQNKFKPIKLKSFPAAFNLLAHLRDEAHRFALKYHKTLRKNLTNKNNLNNISLYE
ncbi:MAG: excinuclease ABC subunit C, partial [Armatimonadetes bacterium]|nr:excinuclease ABC subunit C [Armatimonadota bacterium]